jgi:pimeloyl-ACP methyl ester carboxylesterase
MNPTLAFPPTPTIKTYHLPSPSGQIYILDSNPSTPSKPTLLLIHGNSSCTQIWHPLLTCTPLTRTHRVIALDLPGHGCSDDAPTNQKGDVYTMRGYAECILGILGQLGVRRFCVLGWSLGGHVGVEMLGLLKRNNDANANLNLEMEMKGLMLIGTPPSLGPTQVTAAFSKTPPSPSMALASQEHLTNLEAQNYAVAVTGPPFQEWQVEAVSRTDGQFRKIMFSSFTSGIGVDQVAVVESEKDVLIAVVNGSEDPFVNLDYLDGLRWGRLWAGECVRLDGLGHAPFWEDVGRFYTYLQGFLVECEA